jgi:membrane protein DedA with SNARE-associated domain
MDLAGLVQSYGYWVVAAGALLEGETILALAGAAAHQGFLSLPVVVAVAAVCGFIGDQSFFWLGRLRGHALLRRFPKLAQRMPQVERLVLRWQSGVIVLVRFAYGLRAAGPILLGTMAISPARFAFFNAIGAAIWAVLVGSAGWLLGRAVEALLGEIHNAEAWIFGAVIAIALALGLWRRRRDRAEE